MVLAIVLANPIDARAAEVAIRIHYVAPPGCPTEDAFAQRIRARSPRGKLVQGDANARAFIVNVRSDGNDSVGGIEFTDTAGERVTRVVKGGTCEEVVSGLALVAALAIEAHFVDEDPAQLEAAPAASAPRQIAAEPRASPVSPEEPSAARVGVATERVRWGGGGVVRGDSVTAPGVALGAGFYAEMVWRLPFQSIRLSARRTTASASVGDRTATFTRLGGHLSVCPWAFAPAKRVELATCAGVELGTLRTAGETSSALPSPRSETLLWASADASIEGRVEVLRNVVLEVGAEAVFPLVRREFIFERPDDTLFRIPAVGFGAGASLGVRFP